MNSDTKKGSLKKFSFTNHAIRLDFFNKHPASNMFSVQEVKEECEIPDSKSIGVQKLHFMASPRVFLMDSTEDNLTPKLANFQLSMIDEIIKEEKEEHNLDYADAIKIKKKGKNCYNLRQRRRF